MRKEFDAESVAMDYDFLRTEGIRLLQKMSGTDWTDYNLHDPGVTILEYLCFAITDLAYRTNFDIGDLLTQKDGTIDFEGNSFIKPVEALSSNATTIKDFRKVLLDNVNDITNVWINSLSSFHASDAMKGLYTFYVQVQHDKVLDFDLEQGLKKELLENFITHRNLCEDVSTEVHILKPQDIVISANIIINQNMLPENIIAQIYYAVYEFLHPGVHFYTEKELLSKGHTIDEIYSGPKLKNGFILDEELKDRNLRVDHSELYQWISEVRGVMFVSDLKINNDDNPVLTIDKLNFPYFNIEKSSFIIRDYSDINVISVKQSLVLDIFSNLREQSERHYVRGFHRLQPKEIAGTYVSDDYHSIQKFFPAIYGIGEHGPLSALNAKDVAHAKQLKVYLMFFEQIMANYLAQLNNINELFSNQFTPFSSKTYFTQPLSSVPNFLEMLAEEKKENLKEFFDDLSTVSYEDFLDKGSESPDLFFKRRSKMLDHLLARFNESLSSYPVQQFDKVYGKVQKNQVLNNELEWKSLLLQRVAILSNTRSRGLNYLNRKGVGLNYDFRKKMYLLLYIRNSPDKSLMRVFEDQIIIEKIKPNVLQSIREEEEEEEVPIQLSDEPELSKIISFTRAEFKQEKENGNIISYPLGKDSGETVFQNQPVSFLKYGLNIDNYRLAVDPNVAQSHLLLYKAPGSENWLTVNHYASSIEAITALDELINLLIKTSIKAEGFYLLEHILLRPRVTSANFGFRFYNEKGHLLLESRDWTSFELREDKIAALKLLLFPVPEIEEVIGVLLQDYILPRQKAIGISNAVDELITSINHHMLHPEFEYGRFEMIVRQAEHIIREDDFNFRMSILLPEWPARFQDDVFKDFVKDLFRQESPAHLRLNFFWLNIQEMSVFEGLYSSWLEELAANSETEERLASSNLSHFLTTLQ